MKEAQWGAHAAVHADDMTVFSVAHGSGSIVMQLLHGGSCETCKACLFSDMPSSTDVHICFMGHSSTVQSLTCLTEKLVSTVHSAITFGECDVRSGSLQIS